jgi:hypothetical protein
MTTDNGAGWIPVNDGLTRMHIQTLAVIKDHLAAGAANGGVWRRPLSEMTPPQGIEESAGAGPAAFRLEQNYPNPFNPVTTVCYSLPSASEVRLAVDDGSGRDVAVLVKGKQPAGEHRVTFDGRALNSGMYFYKLEAGSREFTQKMILLK